MIWFGWVLCHIYHCWLFNAKSSLYIYIKHIKFGLVMYHSHGMAIWDMYTDCP